MPTKRIYITTGILAFVGAGLTAVAVTSCDTECTLESRASVIVNIATMDGSAPTPLTAENVWYEKVPDPADADGVDGLAPPAVPHAAVCNNEDCSQWIAGFEEEGEFRVFANICGETVEGRATVEMEPDGCHVATQTIMLEPTNPELCVERPVDNPPDPDDPTCTSEARVSVMVTTIDEGGTHSVPADEVTYLANNSSVLQQAHCANEDCSQWAVGYEVSGDIVINANACGDTGSATVNVGMTEDGCHVETEHVMIEVDGDRCKDKVELPKVCDGVLYPSIYLYVAEDGGDVYLPVKADAVRYEHQGRTDDAQCIDDPKCASWIAGYGIGGPINLEVEACGKVHEQRVEVEMSEDGCKPIAEYVTVLVDKDGCELARPGSEPNPPPPAPSGPGSVDN